MELMATDVIPQMSQALAKSACSGLASTVGGEGLAARDHRVRMDKDHRQHA